MRTGGGGDGGGAGGFTVVEALVALTLWTLLLAAGLTAATGTARAVGGMMRSADALDLFRMARVGLRDELRAGTAGRDWRVRSGDSLTARVFRGWGGVCGRAGGGLAVRYNGLRAPDAAKDSVLMLSDGGEWRAAPLTSARRVRGACPRGVAPEGGAELVLGVAVRASGSLPVLVRVFESGSFHLADGALRYRRGRGGRQPLSPAVLVQPPSRFVPGRVPALILSVGGPALRSPLAVPR